jgi:avidin family protein
MTKRLLLLLTISITAHAQDAALRNKLIGKWANQNQAKGAAILNITAIDSQTGQVRGKYVPPSGAAAGKEFEVVGWVSTLPPKDKLDNVVALSFSVFLSTYGSIASWTGYLRDNTITAMWFNIRPNSGYEWDHIATGQDTFKRAD